MKMHCQSPPKSIQHGRRGVVLFLVVAIVMMLTLLTYGFLISMRTQNLAAAQAGDRLQARQAAYSARDLVCAILESPLSQRQSAGGMNSNPNLFREVRLQLDGEDADELGTYGFVISDANGTRFGVENLSAKIDLNRLVLHDAEIPGFGRECLLRLPNMTAELADRILDWIDEDDEPREFGAESEFYLEENGMSPRNAVPPALDEFSLIPGITSQMIHGHSKNAGPDAVDQDLLGWSEFLTVQCGERNEDFEGNARININGTDLFEIHSQLAAAGNIQLANFVVLARQHGLVAEAAEVSDPQTVTSASDVQVDFTIPASFSFESQLDVFNSIVQIGSAEDDPENVIRIGSPFRVSTSTMDDQMLAFLDQSSTTDAPYLGGRVNIMLARREVLLSVPGINEELADLIISNRENQQEAKTSFWLLSTGLINMEQMRQVEPFISNRGEICRLVVGGVSDRRSAPFVFELWLDATSGTTRQVKSRRILDAGRFKRLMPDATNARQDE